MRGKGLSGPESKRIVSGRWVRQASNTEKKQRMAFTRGERGGATVVEVCERRVMVDCVGDGARQSRSGFPNHRAD